MNNNETVAVQLEKERTKNLKCNRSSEKYEIQWRKVEKQECFILFFFSQLDSIQNGKLYPAGNVYSDSKSYALDLKGSADEIGNYTCHWNNSLGEARYKIFIVTYVDERKTRTSIAVAVPIFLAILLFISIAVGVRFYLLKVIETLKAIKRCCRNN